MDWGASPAVRALRQAGAVAAVARRVGCGPGEAADMLAERAAPAAGERGGVPRRAVLGGAGAAALTAAVPAGWLSPPRPAPDRPAGPGRDPDRPAWRGSRREPGPALRPHLA